MIWTRLWKQILVNKCFLFFLAPGVAALAADGAWAEEYLAAEAQGRPLGPDWSAEFLANKPPDWLHREAGAAAALPERQWAQDFLARNEHKEWCVFDCRCRMCLNGAPKSYKVIMFRDVIDTPSIDALYISLH